jgi:methionyl-tRNA synthetase
MNNNYNVEQFVNGGVPLWLPVVGLAFFVVLIWSFVWKGLALWHSAKRHSPYWFIAFLVINTAGILEIIYLFGVLKLKFNQLFSK